jgi:hypothetical protein
VGIGKRARVTEYLLEVRLDEIHCPRPISHTSRVHQDRIFISIIEELIGEMKGADTEIGNADRPRKNFWTETPDYFHPKAVVPQKNIA